MNKKIRVLTVLRHPASGIRTYLRYTYNKLDRRKYHFTILTVKDKETTQLKRDLAGLSSEFIEVDRFDLSFFHQLFNVLSGREIHVIHSQGYSCGIFVSFLNLFYGIPHIITFHGTFDDRTLKGRVIFLKKRITLFLLSRAEVINVVSEDARNNLLTYFPGLKRCLYKIAVIENGIDVDYFTETIRDEKRISDIKGIEKDSYVVGYLGRYMPEKGFPILIDAVEILSRPPHIIQTVKVLALGWGAYIREYQALIKEKKLSNYFVFIEFQSDVRWVLRQADLLVIPSLREAYPLVAMEGLVSGTPIVASDCIGLREVLKHSPASMLKAGDPGKLADAIKETIKNPKKQAATQYIPEAIKRFDAGNTAAKLDEVFTDLQKVGRKRFNTSEASA